MALASDFTTRPSADSEVVFRAVAISLKIWAEGCFAQTLNMTLVGVQDFLLRGRQGLKPDLIWG